MDEDDAAEIPRSAAPDAADGRARRRARGGGHRPAGGDGVADHRAQPGRRSADLGHRCRVRPAANNGFGVYAVFGPVDPGDLLLKDANRFLAAVWLHPGGGASGSPGQGELNADGTFS